MAGDLILPSENVPIDWKRYLLSFVFHPPIKLSRNDALIFAQGIAPFMELEVVEPGIEEWHFAGGAACDGMHLNISKQSLELDVHLPSNSLEWYEHRFDPILDVFVSTFSPQIALNCKVIVSGLIDLSEQVDALSFLGGYVMVMHPSKLNPINRPLHMLGVRLFFPPFTDDDGNNTDWGATVRIESAMDGSNKLFLEVTAEWSNPGDWEETFVSEAVRRVGVVSNFMSDKLVKFLRQPPFPEDNEDSDEDNDDGE